MRVFAILETGGHPCAKNMRGLTSCTKRSLQQAHVTMHPSELLPHFSTLAPNKHNVCLSLVLELSPKHKHERRRSISVALVLEFLRQAVSLRSALRCSDFPHRFGKPNQARSPSCFFPQQNCSTKNQFCQQTKKPCNTGKTFVFLISRTLGLN